MVRLKLAAALLAAFAGASFAAVPADEARKLGGAELTPWGAEKAGNKEGTIPAYTGTPLKAPANYDPKKPGQHPSPFAGEKPLFTITAQNHAQYADKLDALGELFKRYPDYRMEVYPSHRNFVYPQWVLDNTVKNATGCKGVDNELKLEGCYAGFPFPLPKTGNQVMWNHLLQFSAVSLAGGSESYVVPTNGSPSMQVASWSVFHFPFYAQENRNAPRSSDSVFWAVRVNDIGPARRTGGVTMVLDSLDMVGTGRRAYQYIPGQRRVKLAPDLAYDTPSPYGGGATTMDDQKGFMGALDRFDFKLIGKKEKFIPYNSYELADHGACPIEKLTATKNFPNPACMRWELHRVWMVEATLKPGYRHVYKKRVFFWDEDVPGHGTAENYDAAGKLYRVTLNVTYPFYSAPGGVGGSVADAPLFMDVQTGIWGFSGVGNCADAQCGNRAVVDMPKDYWSPESMAASGVR